MSSATTSGPRARQPQSRPGIAVNKARLGRVALILLLLLMASSYVRPALDWVNARGTAAQQEQRLVKLQASEKQLKADKVRLSTARGMAVEARRLGMVREGERAYVVRGLPND